MKSQWLSILVILCGSIQAVAGQETISPETIKEIKKATVLIKVPNGDKVALGSGWVLKVDGETAFLVTNQHVVADAPKGKVYPEVTVVFRSGTKQELSMTAEVLAVERQSDLAVLRVTGVMDLPKPIKIDPGREVVETQPVIVFGFPHTGLDGGRNPPITVTSGAVSSIRDDDIVQLDTNLNPGNSGGPVVDTKGRLVGIAFARPKGGEEVITGIGLAVQPAALTAMLDSRIGESGIVSKNVSGGKAEIEIEITLIDPYEKIKTITVHHVSADKVGDKPIAEMAGSNKVDFAVKNQRIMGKFTVETAKPGVASYFCQASIMTADGKQLTTKPLPFHVNFKVETEKKGELVAFKQDYGFTNVNHLAYAPNGKTLAVALSNTEVHLFDLATGWMSTAFKEHKHEVFRVAFSPDGKWLASASSGGDPKITTICLRDTGTGKVVHTIEDQTRFGLNCIIAFSHDARILAVGSRDNEVVFFDVATGKRGEGVKVPRTGNTVFPIHCLGFSPDGKLLATGGADGFCRLWDVATVKELSSFSPGENDYFESLAWSADGKTLAAGSFHGTIKIWDMAAKKVRSELKGHHETVLDMSLNSDGTLLATAGWDDTVRVWHVAGAREIAKLYGDNGLVSGKGGPRCVTISPDDQYLAIGQTILNVMSLTQVMEKFPSAK